MNGVALEAYLARLYTDPAACESFLADPVNAARAAGLGEDEATSLDNIDRIGLRMAAASFAHKRQQHRRPKRSLYQLLRQWLAKH